MIMGKHLNYLSIHLHHGSVSGEGILQQITRETVTWKALPELKFRLRTVCDNLSNVGTLSSQKGNMPYKGLRAIYGIVPYIIKCQLDTTI